MTQEWRATGGKVGLPVVDFGHVLRVPRAALEQLLGIDLSGAATAPPATTAEQSMASGAPAAVDADPIENDDAPASRPSRRHRPRTAQPKSTDQLDFFGTAS